jgi:hypothetical protein
LSFLTLDNSSIFSILFMSANLVESLAVSVYHWNDINATVARTANIVITTMSSTKVKAFLFIFIKDKIKYMHIIFFYIIIQFINKKLLYIL